jgi:hypothetical protein
MKTRERTSSIPYPRKSTPEEYDLGERNVIAEIGHFPGSILGKETVRPWPQSSVSI